MMEVVSPEYKYCVIQFTAPNSVFPCVCVPITWILYPEKHLLATGKPILVKYPVEDSHDTETRVQNCEDFLRGWNFYQARFVTGADTYNAAKKFIFWNFGNPTNENNLPNTRNEDGYSSAVPEVRSNVQQNNPVTCIPDPQYHIKVAAVAQKRRRQSNSRKNPDKLLKSATFSNSNKILDESYLKTLPRYQIQTSEINNEQENFTRSSNMEETPNSQDLHHQSQLPLSTPAKNQPPLINKANLEHSMPVQETPMEITNDRSNNAQKAFPSEIYLNEIENRLAQIHGGHSNDVCNEKETTRPQQYTCRQNDKRVTECNTEYTALPPVQNPPNAEDNSSQPPTCQIEIQSTQVQENHYEPDQVTVPSLDSENVIKQQTLPLENNATNIHRIPKVVLRRLKDDNLIKEGTSKPERRRNEPRAARSKYCVEHNSPAEQNTPKSVSKHQKSTTDNSTQSIKYFVHSPIGEFENAPTQCHQDHIQYGDCLQDVPVRRYFCYKHCFPKRPHLYVNMENRPSDIQNAVNIPYQTRGTLFESPQVLINLFELVKTSNENLCNLSNKANENISNLTNKAGEYVNNLSCKLFQTLGNIKKSEYMINASKDQHQRVSVDNVNESSQTDNTVNFRNEDRELLTINDENNNDDEEPIVKIEQESTFTDYEDSNH